MATNPMQRKARNSFLLGMLLMLLISGAIIGVLGMQLMNKNKAEQEYLAGMTKVYTLGTDVRSGQIITTDMLVPHDVNRDLVPSNATGDIGPIQNYALTDKEGNEILQRTSNDSNAEQKLYIKKDNREYEVLRETETDNLYIERNNEKEYLELNTVPLVAKVNMRKNTVITTELLSKIDNALQDDIRKQEYNMFILPMDLVTGDYVDIRLQLPSGQDFIVVSKKEVEVPNIAGVDSEDTIWVDLSEDEILHMSCAIIEAYQINGAKLYVTKYTEPGMQIAATPTYPLNERTTTLLRNDPNIVERAMNAIISRYDSTNASELRNNHINGILNEQGEQTQSNLQTKMEESITNQKNSRKEYLDALSGIPAGE